MPRYLLPLPLTLLALLCGCPPAGRPATQQPARPPAASTVPEPPPSVELPVDGVDYPPLALDYLLESLKSPTEGHPGLGASWDTIAQLPWIASGDGPAELRQELARQLELAGDAPPPELVAAQFAAVPSWGLQFVAKQLEQEQWQYLGSLWHVPEAGRELLCAGDRAALHASLSPEAVLLVLRLLEAWGGARSGDTALLTALAAREEPAAALPACGWLLRLDPARDAERQRLREAIGDGKAAFPRHSAAADGIRFSRDKQLADALVNVLAHVEVGEVEDKKEKHRAVMASNALAYLPGEQATMLRERLTRAADPAVAWPARLGQLLHGEPAAWNRAVDARSIDSMDLWIALNPAEARDPLLLETYELGSRSKQTRTRGTAAAQLNRFTQQASDSNVVELLSRLVADESDSVRRQAWRTAAQLRTPGLSELAMKTVIDEKQNPEVRMQACFYALRLAEPAAAVPPAGSATAPEASR